MQFDVRGARELAVRYDNAPALVAETSFRVIRRIVGRLQSYVVTRKLSGQSLNARTRNLARSVFSRVELSGGDAVGRVGFDLKKAVYGRIHELGGVIVPVRAKNLTIPVNSALTPSGVARFDARELFNNTGPGRSIHGFTFAFMNQNKTAIMGMKRGGDIEALFLLRKRVVIPKAAPLAETLDENRQEIIDALETGVVEALVKIKQVG
jgi:hypothetical protein